MNQSLYRDIALRCDGDIYIGVVGPVRTGKSTFIKRFMELIVLPNIAGEHRRERAKDELPVSGAGRTIMTTQPKFVPDEAVEVTLRDQASFKVRLVDCVGYLIRGVLGLSEGESARMVRTPWLDHDIPFEEAAEMGTRKVIAEHSTLGIVVTTDGSVTDMPRANYAEAEERVVRELAQLGKPFIVILNTKYPGSDDARALASSLSDKYMVTVTPLDVENMSVNDVNGALESLLFEFPISEIIVEPPKWVDALKPGHALTQSIIGAITEAAQEISRVREHNKIAAALMELDDAESADIADFRLNEGAVRYKLRMKDQLFYRVLGEESGQEIENEEHLFRIMTEMVYAKREYDRVKDALSSARATGYGMVTPVMSELSLLKPEIIRQGSRFGVKLRANAPSLHIIRVDIETEVSPLVGTEKQSEELVQYLMSEFEGEPDKIWETNIFGKSLNELVREGLSGKLTQMPADVRGKTQEALSKIINEGNGGMICILL